MNATLDCGSADWSPVSDRPIDVVDPLDHDMPDDEAFLTTRRALCRVVTVATEAGARFQRDGGGIDPMAWMLAPRRMFGGAAPIEACTRRDEFVRGVIVHGLGLDLDMDAEAIDEIVGGEPGDDDALGDEGVISAAGDVPDPSAQRLFTAVIVSHDGFETVHAFHASLAVDEAEIAARLYCRIGAACADAVIVDGFDADAPMVEALVAPAIADTLRQVAAYPLSPLAAGLDLNIEQRFLG